MKIQLVTKNTTQYEDCQIVQLNDLQKIENATCTLIHMGNCLEFVNGSLLEVALKKLRYGGRIIIEGTDLLEVIYGYFRDVITLQEVQALLFIGRHACYTLENMVNVLRAAGLTIISNRLTQYRYTITAERSYENNML